MALNIKFKDLYLKSIALAKGLDLVILGLRELKYSERMS